LLLLPFPYTTLFRSRRDGVGWFSSVQGRWVTRRDVIASSSSVSTEASMRLTPDSSSHSLDQLARSLPEVASSSSRRSDSSVFDQDRKSTRLNSSHVS